MRVVDGFLRVRQHERRRGLLATVMTRVRLRHHEALLERLAPLRCAARVLETLAGMAAVADHVQPAVPRRRQIDLERDLGCEYSADAAMLRRVALRGYRLR